jgi:hypothetical protein
LSHRLGSSPFDGVPEDAVKPISLYDALSQTPNVKEVLVGPDTYKIMRKGVYSTFSASWRCGTKSESLRRTSQLKELGARRMPLELKTLAGPGSTSGGLWKRLQGTK